jgi:translocator protein
MKQKIFVLMGSIGVCLFAGMIGSLFTFSSIPTWYAALRKPFFSPPNWVFGPVWTTLYILMGISFYQILIVKKHVLKERGVLLFVFQLILNSLWSIVFFGLRLPGMALLTIIALWWSIYLTIQVFLKIHRSAGLLLAPYLTWVSFATLLNIAIVYLN